MSYVQAISQRRRLALLNLVLVAFGVVLVNRLFYIQVVSRQRYALLASKSQLRQYSVPASRGQIYIHDGEDKTPLVLNETLKTVYADPTLVHDKPKTAGLIAGALGVPTAEIYNHLNVAGAYAVLKAKLTADQADRVKNLNLLGVGITDQQYRVYPEGQLASQLTGFVNADGDGQYGLEAYLNDDLSGTPGLLNAKTDTNGLPIATADNLVKPAVNGKSYILTIDRNIQAQAEKYLKDGVDKVGAKSGSVVVMDPDSGAIKAMANYPTYDPNQYNQVSDYNTFANSVVSNQFEPGSGFKVFTMATGLDTGKVKPDTPYDDTGTVVVDGRTINNASNHKFGHQTMTDVIQKSLNTGVIFVLKQLGGDANNINLAGKKVLYEYLTKRFGFGVATGIEQPGEARGSVNGPTNNSGNNVNYANMTFGQGVSVTMMQMVTGVAAIANGGKLYQPHLIDQITASDGSTQTITPRIVNPSVVSAATSRDLATMMIQVVEHGSGYAAKIKGYQVAGKTGTAQIPRADGQGYEENKNIGSFVGFAPVNHPRFVMMVRINEPNVSGFAESTTVPVFGSIAQWLLNYYQVPPTG